MLENPYHTKDYNSRARWATYYIQWRTLADVLPKGREILEIGAGAEVVSSQLRILGYSVTTFSSQGSKKIEKRY